jgi:hypothetical protein
VKRPFRIPSPLDVYELRVVVRDIEPAIWRRLRVPARVTLAELHEVLQIAFGWKNCHLHDFTVGEACFGMAEVADEVLVVDERTAPLGAVAREGTMFTYRYDFGDDWEHEVVVERAVDGTPEIRLECTDGERAGPLEDSGGAHGYMHTLEVLRDHNHEEHAEVRQWAPKKFDTARFDVAATNRKLGVLARRIRRRL